MTHSSAEAVFADLKLPEGEGHVFSTTAFGKGGLARVGKSSDGTPAFLLASTDPSLNPIQLRNLRAVFNAHCRVVVGHESVDEQLTIVECLSQDTAVHGLFLRGLEPIMLRLGEHPSATETREAVETLVELFRALSRPAKKSVVGLWGELFLIARAQDPFTLVESWHMDAQELFDFANEGERIDVKITRSDRRRHAVALDQLRQEGTQVAIASIQTEPSGGGASLYELMEEVLARLTKSPQLQLRVMQAIAGSLGSEWSEALGTRFDRDRARNTLAFFDGDEIPSVRLPLPPEVSDVHFVVDVTECEPISRQSLRKAGGLWAAAAPSGH